MEEIAFTYDGAQAPKSLATATKRLAPALKAMHDALGKGYEDERAFVNLCADEELLQKSVALAEKLQGTDLLVVIGIGGSNLGTLAVQEALQGRLHNETERLKVYYADTVDTRSMETVLRLVKEGAAAKKRIVLNVISKSGTTTETVANLALLLEGVGRKEHTVVVTTDEGSKLWQLGKKEGYHLLPIPKRVGGRYSVLSPVGAFPLALMGIDAASLLKGAATMRKRCLKENDNPAMLGAALQYCHLKEGKNIADLFLFATDYEALGKWNRQLVAESVGKERDRSGKKKVYAGVTPTVSIGSTDLHSVGQLYLGGPYDKLTTFVTVHEKEHLTVPKGWNGLVASIDGKTLAELMDAVAKGTMAACKKAKRPYLHIHFPARNAYSLGQFMQYKMMETVYLAHLLDVNPFDQPNVELYKEEMRKILAKKG